MSGNHILAATINYSKNIGPRRALTSNSFSLNRGNYLIGHWALVSNFHLKLKKQNQADKCEYEMTSLDERTRLKSI